MNILGPDPNEEKEEIISDTIDLYQEIINKDSNEVEKGSTVYSKEYEKLLDRLCKHFERDILGPGIPDFLRDLLDEWRSTRSNLEKRSTIVKRIERGLKKIMRKFGIEIPEAKQSFNRNINAPVIQNILSANQSMNNQIAISNEIKIEVDQAITEFVNETNKSTPNPSKLKKLFEIIKKGTGYGTIKIVEVLLKKLFGV